MFKTIGKTIMGAALSFAAFAGFSGEASASDYCREYTRSVYVGGRVQEAYGTACYQPDGSWMIVGEGLGNDIPSNVSDVRYVIRDNDRYITPNRVVYYDTRPTYRRQASPIFVWNYNSDRYYRKGHYVNYNRGRDRDYGWNDHRRGRGHDRHDHRGRGNGHWRD